MSRSTVAGALENGLGPRPMGGPPKLPPGLSERTMGKHVISTAPKDTDLLSLEVPVSKVPRNKDRPSVQLFDAGVGRALHEVRLHSVRLVLPVSPPLLVLEKSVKESWWMKLLLWGETDGIFSSDLLRVAFILWPMDKTMCSSTDGQHA